MRISSVRNPSSNIGPVGLEWKNFSTMGINRGRGSIPEEAGPGGATTTTIDTPVHLPGFCRRGIITIITINNGVKTNKWAVGPMRTGFTPHPMVFPIPLDDAVPR